MMIYHNRMYVCHKANKRSIYLSIYLYLSNWMLAYVAFVQKSFY